MKTKNAIIIIGLGVAAIGAVTYFGKNTGIVDYFSGSSTARQIASEQQSSRPEQTTLFGTDPVSDTIYGEKSFIDPVPVATSPVTSSVSSSIKRMTADQTARYSDTGRVPPTPTDQGVFKNVFNSDPIIVRDGTTTASNIVGRAAQAAVAVSPVGLAKYVPAVQVVNKVGTKVVEEGALGFVKNNIDAISSGWDSFTDRIGAIFG